MVGVRLAPNPCPNQAADFGARPFCCDHGAHVPIVATLLPRPGGDGVHLYASGTQAGLATAIA